MSRTILKQVISQVTGLRTRYEILFLCNPLVSGDVRGSNFIMN